jgi:hypothetical protein
MARLHSTFYFADSNAIYIWCAVLCAPLYLILLHREVAPKSPFSRVSRGVPHEGDLDRPLRHGHRHAAPFRNVPGARFEEHGEFNSGCWEGCRCRRHSGAELSWRKWLRGWADRRSGVSTSVAGFEAVGSKLKNLVGTQVTAPILSASE